MRELLRDPKEMTEVVRRRVLRALVPAIGKLTRVARGRDAFRNDHEIRACIALARLAPIFLAQARDADADAAAEARDLRGTIYDPAWLTPERELDLKRLDWLASLPKEEHERREAERNARYEAWDASRPTFDSPDELCAYYRTHRPPSFEELEEEHLWPDHLKSPAKTAKGDDHA